MAKKKKSQPDKPTAKPVERAASTGKAARCVCVLDHADAKYFGTHEIDVVCEDGESLEQAGRRMYFAKAGISSSLHAVKVEPCSQ